MIYTLDMLAQELEDLQLATFDYDVAWKLGSIMQTQASARSLPAAITVAHGTDVVFALLMPAATPDNTAWAARKRAVAHRFHRSSLAMRLEAEQGGYDFNSRFRLPDSDFVASGGGFPLMLRGGTLIGTLGVSGLPDVEDHLLVTNALRELLDLDRPVASE
ncbi:heme-degrading domain-containing protein [Rhizobium laguerreae]|uniref:heme-degrading domain-containing protein n=1 Tax=Rhizobium laguerreae TaxID=1076926 RepID=UPI001C91BD63|nr:heme-degrading domain-containing protein [Rhizobium laguerreae]MBY3217710.1 heme-degrading domain-containing protein [Rhizobium laguerreae]